MPATSAAAASSRVITLSMVRWPWPFSARRSATVGFLRMSKGSDDGDGLFEPAKATHCVAPVRRPERASAEAEGGAAWTDVRNRGASAPVGAESRPPLGGRARPDLSTDKSGGTVERVSRFTWRSC